MRSIALLLALALALPAHASDVIWRSRSTGVLRTPATPVVTGPETETPTETPASGMTVEFFGATTVKVGGAINLLPVVSGVKGYVMYSPAGGTWPPGVKVNASTGRIEGKATAAGTYEVMLSAADITPTSVVTTMVKVTIVVTS